MKRLVLVVFSVLIFPSLPMAGWWNKPANFDECVLEKMKGQDKSVRPYAVRACRRLFPPLERIEGGKESRIKTSWSQKGDTLHIKIHSNESGYRIDKIEAEFSTTKCEEIGRNSKTEQQKFFDEMLAYELVKMFSFEKSETKSSVRIDSQKKYQCMRQKAAWGYKKAN